MRPGNQTPDLWFHTYAGHHVDFACRANDAELVPDASDAAREDGIDFFAVGVGEFLISELFVRFKNFVVPLFYYCSLVAEPLFPKAVIPTKSCDYCVSCTKHNRNRLEIIQILIYDCGKED